MIKIICMHKKFLKILVIKRDKSGLSLEDNFFGEILKSPDLSLML